MLDFEGTGPPLAFRATRHPSMKVRKFGRGLVGRRQKGAHHVFDVLSLGHSDCGGFLRPFV
eukprot:8617128-Pyramimonas_sp.AAC.1